MSELTDNPIANIVASLVGGGLPVAGSFDLRSGPQAPQMNCCHICPFRICPRMNEPLSRGRKLRQRQQ